MKHWQIRLASGDVSIAVSQIWMLFPLQTISGRFTRTQYQTRVPLRPLNLVSQVDRKTANTIGPPQHTSSPKKNRNKPSSAANSKPNQIKVCTIKFGSLVSHNKHLKVKLHQFLETHKPDIVLGYETNLNTEIDSREIFPDYYLHRPPNRKDRDTSEKGGGVLIAVKGSISSVEQLSPADCEITWTKISLLGGDILFGSFYRPPKSPIDHLEQLELLMNNLKQLNGLHGKHVILGGDFNLPDINWQDGSIRANQQYSAAINEKMVDIMDEFNLTQMVLEPTHQGNILDLVFTTHPELIILTRPM